MKMRLKPLRGQKYKAEGHECELVFVEKIDESDLVKVYGFGGIFLLHIDDLNLPIIDTKDYEKIAEDKKHHD